MPRNSPRISVNKLGEYMTAHPVRRRAIIKGQKDPSPAIVPRYRRAFPVLEQFFASSDPSVVYEAADRLANGDFSSDWDADDSRNTAEGLEAFMDIIDQLPLDDCEIVRPDTDEFPKIRMGGVDVSVRPDFWIKQTRRGRDYVGAFKFHWTKDDKMALGESGGTYVATTLHQFLSDHGPGFGSPDHRLCFSVDVFRREVWVAPTSYLRLSTHLVAACEEIALRWDTL
jgi:hypothetical protein